MSSFLTLCRLAGRNTVWHQLRLTSSRSYGGHQGEEPVVHVGESVFRERMALTSAEKECQPAGCRPRSLLDYAQVLLIGRFHASPGNFARSLEEITWAASLTSHSVPVRSRGAISATKIGSSSFPSKFCSNSARLT